MLKSVATVLTLILLGCAFSVSASSAVPDNVLRDMPDAKTAGKARYSYLFWDIYDATLYAPQGNWQQNKPFALVLTYLRDFDGNDIAERSIKEMKAQGLKDSTQIKRWLQEMQRLFPDVKAQDTLTGVKTASGATQFYFNNEWLGEVTEPDFSAWFFNIWLGPKTTEPEFRAKLLQQESSS